MHLQRVLAGKPKLALEWQPDPETNTIALTVWHVCRVLDILKVKILEYQQDDMQLWYARGWASKTNYDPPGWPKVIGVLPG
jgi:hypothetical protein